MKTKLFTLVATGTLFLAACSPQTELPANTAGEESTSEVTVFTTLYPLQYFTEQIGGDLVNVQSIYPPGSDEHTFEPTQQDMIKLADADYLFSIGLGLEGFIESAEKTLANQQVEIVHLADSISDETLEGLTEKAESLSEEEHSEEEHAEEAESHDGHAHGDLDPHVWISPTLSIELAKSIRDHLIEVSPEHQQEFEASYEELEQELLALDQSFKDMVAESNRDTFFVSHAAFGYWANEYGLEQVAVAGLSSQDEPSQKELANLVDQAREQDIQYILTEQNVSSKLTDIIRAEVGAETLPLHNLGVLTQEDVDAGETYFTLMEKNIETLKTALQ